MATPFASHVPADFWNNLSRAGEMRTYEAGEALYRSGRQADGIYLIQAGEVSFRFALAKDRKKRILQNAGAGAILALGEVMCGERHKLTVEAVRPTQISFVTRPQLMEFLRTTPLACVQVVQLLSNDLDRLYQTLRRYSSRG